MPKLIEFVALLGLTAAAIYEPVTDRPNDQTLPNFNQNGMTYGVRNWDFRQPNLPNFGINSNFGAHGGIFGMQISQQPFGNNFNTGGFPNNNGNQNAGGFGNGNDFGNSNANGNQNGGSSNRNFGNAGSGERNQNNRQVQREQALGNSNNNNKNKNGNSNTRSPTSFESSNNQNSNARNQVKHIADVDALDTFEEEEEKEFEQPTSRTRGLNARGSSHRNANKEANNDDRMVPFESPRERTATRAERRWLSVDDDEGAGAVDMPLRRGIARPSDSSEGDRTDRLDERTIANRRADDEGKSSRSNHDNRRKEYFVPRHSPRLDDDDLQTHRRHMHHDDRSPSHHHKFNDDDDDFEPRIKITDDSLPERRRGNDKVDNLRIRSQVGRSGTNRGDELESIEASDEKFNRFDRRERGSMEGSKHAGGFDNRHRFRSESREVRKTIEDQDDYIEPIPVHRMGIVFD